jgi:hypothetical protein
MIFFLQGFVDEKMIKKHTHVRIASLNNIFLMRFRLFIDVSDIIL